MEAGPWNGKHKPLGYLLIPYGEKRTAIAHVLGDSHHNLKGRKSSVDISVALDVKIH